MVFHLWVSVRVWVLSSYLMEYVAYGALTNIRLCQNSDISLNCLEKNKQQNSFVVPGRGIRV